MKTDCHSILFICPTRTQPRYIKRVEAALEAGFRVEVAAFDRGYYSSNEFPKEVSLLTLPPIENGKYAQRFPKLVIARRILQTHYRNFSAIYSFSTDTYLLGNAISAQIRIHEVGDLRFFKKGGTVAKRLLKKLEALAFLGCHRIVVTSPSFAEFFSTSRCVVSTLENKLPRNFASRPCNTSIVRSGKIQVGLIGLLRYETIRTLLEVTQTLSDKVDLQVWGDGPLVDLVETATAQSDNIAYHGQFKYPIDLKDIYSGIDISFVAYDTRDENVRLALPNKLYESLFFGIPIIASAGTHLAERVLELEAGFSVDPMNSRCLLELLSKLTKTQLASIQQRILSTIPSKSLVDESPVFFRNLSKDLSQRNRQ